MSYLSTQRYGWSWAAFALFLVGFYVPAALAQPKAAPAKAATKSTEPEIPEPTDELIETKDGVQLKATYYPGTLKESAVPVIMLHGWDGNHNDFHNLALQVQSRGHAVIAPDLRGHGASKKQKTADGKTRNLDVSSLVAKDFLAMEEDLESIKRFLMARNNKKELNIDMLTIVASDVSCITALNWSMKDWSVARLPGFKQGQDVKGLVLLSPVQTFKGSSMQQSLTALSKVNELSFLIFAGRQDAKSMADARRMDTTLTGHRGKPATDEDRSIWLYELETSLKGIKLLREKELKVDQLIMGFIKLRVSDREDSFPWKDRKRPLED